MKRILLLISLLPFVGACFAIVDEGVRTREIKSFGISKGWVSDTLEEIKETKPDYEIPKVGKQASN